MTKIRYISLLIIFGPAPATARAPSTRHLRRYASALAEGTWVKAAVATDGLYAISPAQLPRPYRPQRAVVRLRRPTHTPGLTRRNFVDDLPVAPCDYDERLAW